MDINEELVKQIAENSRLVLTEDEVKEFKKEFKETLEHFSNIQNADIQEEPAFHPIKLKNHTNNDNIEPENCLTQEEALSNVKQTYEGYIKGPKVIK
ncbi:MAG: Asp-tRNA(Asn)/Glu-tRNA(Gln) amidotransferase subunit GatC [Nanobdellota archaeon]